MPALVANLAVEIAPIRVNLIAPGFVDTGLSASLLGDGLEARREQLRATLPIGRVVGPADVAALAVHLMANTALTGRDVRHRWWPAAGSRLSMSTTGPDVSAQRLVSDADHVQLSRLVVEAAWRVDLGRSDTLHELFIADGELDLGESTLRGPDAIRDWGLDVVRANTYPGIRHVAVEHAVRRHGSGQCRGYDDAHRLHGRQRRLGDQRALGGRRGPRPVRADGAGLAVRPSVVGAALHSWLGGRASVGPMSRRRRSRRESRVIGLLGGMSWESSAEYYRLVNELVRERLGGLHSARCLLASVDFAEIEALQVNGEWEAAGQILADVARRLEAGGAELLLICTNTMHKVADQVQAAVDIPLLHIADVTADAVLAAGLDTVALLGTAFTMEQAFYRERLEARGLTVLVPPAPDRAEVHRIIYDELLSRRDPGALARGLSRRHRAAGRGRCAGNHLGLHRDRAARLGGRQPGAGLRHDASARRGRGGGGAGSLAGAGPVGCRGPELMRIAVLSPGEMGSAVGQALAAVGHEVGWLPAGRSRATAERAERAGLAAWADLDGCELVVSICPPAAALETARSVAGFAGFAGTYLDANAISPTDRRAGGRDCHGRRRGVRRRRDHRTASGDGLAALGCTCPALGARPVAEAFEGSLVSAVVVPDSGPYAASAVKMTYAAWTKISAALLLSAHETAVSLGVDDVLLAEWAASQPELADRLAAAGDSAARKGWRWEDEMRQIAETFAAVGQPEGFGAAAAEVFSRFPQAR